MSDPAWFPEQADLERKVGAAYKLVELAGATSAADSLYASFVANCLARGRGSVRRFVEVKFEPEQIDQLDTESTISLRYFGTVKAAVAAYRDSTSGMAIPDDLREEDKEVDKHLEAIAHGDERLGRGSNMPGPALGERVGVVNFDPNNCGLSMSSLGYWGFR